MRRAFCEEGNHFPVTLIAHCFIPNSEEQIAVQLKNNGEVTNTYWDGIRGVTEFHAELAEEDEEPTCYEHPGCYVTWKDV